MKELTRTIVIDPERRFGKPTIKGTRLTVDEVLGFLASGMTYDEIRTEYGLRPLQIRAVVEYAANFLKGEQVKERQLQRA